MAGGHFYLGGGTAVQKATGIEDSAEEMFNYIRAVSKEPEDDKIRAYCDDSVEHFDWLEALGLEFERTFWPGKAVIQPGTEGLMYTGNEKVHPFRDLAVPAPRGHKVPVPGDTGGAKLVVDRMADRLVETSAEIRYETGATNLVIEDGRVVGLAWRRFEARGAIRAKAVILAAGGFVGNADMVAEHTPRLGEKLFPLASTYDDGLGLRLGASAGGAGGSWTSRSRPRRSTRPRSCSPGSSSTSTASGFVSEDSCHARTAAFVMEQPDSAAFLIVDSAHIEHPKMPLCPFIDGWETVEEMAAGLGVPFEALNATLTSYNTHAADGKDPELRKALELDRAAGHRPVGRLRPLPRQGHVRRVHHGRSGDHRRRRGTPRGRLPDRGPLRRRRLRGQPRPGRQGLRLRHAARRRLVLRAARRTACGRAELTCG